MQQRHYHVHRVWFLSSKYFFEKFHCFQDYEAKNYSIVLEPERFLEV